MKDCYKYRYANLGGTKCRGYFDTRFTGNRREWIADCKKDSGDRKVYVSIERKI